MTITNNNRTRSPDEGAVVRQLGDGLVLRRGRVEDTEALADFTANHVGPESPDEEIRHWTRDLMTGDLPGFGPQDFTLVEDTATGAIVSTLCLISQTWSYEGVEFGVGRVELVGTDPAYRLRGLMRAQLETVHGWSAERGEMAQGITGIPWFYRRFDYEMVMEHMGGRIGAVDDVPELKPGQSEPFRLRAATDADIPFLDRLYQRSAARYVVSCVRGEEMWRYELFGRREGSQYRFDVLVVESQDGDPAGYVLVMAGLSGGELAAMAFEVAPEFSWLSITPSVLRQLRAIGESRADGGPFHGIRLTFGSEHPSYEVAGDMLSRSERPYAWYIRVPDMPAFVLRIGPVLERRLAGSFAAGYSGDLGLSFFDDGLRVVFESGKLVESEKWMTGERDNRHAPKERDALFPGLIFHQLLFGHRSVEELEHAFPDCIVSSDHSRALLNALFPRHTSRIWGLE
jgi:hypothetical protein